MKAIRNALTAWLTVGILLLAMTTAPAPYSEMAVIAGIGLLMYVELRPFSRRRDF